MTWIFPFGPYEVEPTKRRIQKDEKNPPPTFPSYPFGGGYGTTTTTTSIIKKFFKTGSNWLDFVYLHKLSRNI